MDFLAIRQFLRGLVDSSKTTSQIPPGLKALVSRQVPKEKADDVLQELLVDLLARRGQVGCPLKLAELPEPVLKKLLVCRISQVVLANCPRFSLMKLFRLKATRALKGTLPVAPASLPPTLMEKGEVKVALVKDAVAYAVTQGVPKEVKPLAKFLFEHYHFEHSQIAADELLAEKAVATAPFAEPEFDLAMAANGLKKKMDPELLALFLKYREGATLKEMVTPGAKVTKTHQLLKKASALVKEYFLSKGLAAAEADKVLEALSAGPYPLAA